MDIVTNVLTQATGEERNTVLPLPEHFTVTVTRSDGYAPTQMEMIVALQVALEIVMKPNAKSPL